MPIDLTPHQENAIRWGFEKEYGPYTACMYARGEGGQRQIPSLYHDYRNAIAGDTTRRETLVRDYDAAPDQASSRVMVDEVKKLGKIYTPLPCLKRQDEGASR